VDVQGKKVTVVGLGRTAVALVRLLLREGAKPFVTDNGAADPALTRELDNLGIGYETDGHSDEAFSEATLIVPSPGVSPTVEPIRAAAERGVPVIGEMEFASTRCRSQVLAVTGTNGKTTTTELLRALIEATGHSVVLAGNNDEPFSAAVCREPAPEYIVLEVSSYQLETARTFRPWVASVLNITPDHLARHGDVDAYAHVKAGIFLNQGAGDVAVLNRDDARVRCMADGLAADVQWFSLNERVERGLWLDGDAIMCGSSVVAHRADIRLPGRHNLENVLAALCMARQVDGDWNAVLDALRAFAGVEHRIEFLSGIEGVDYYNDSKSTNIDSLKVALESFTRPIVLIAGGEGKGADYGVLRELVRERVKSLVAIGADAPLLEAAFGDVTAVSHAGDMDAAVSCAAAQAERGDVLLLSPGCASFDMFENFEARGRAFKASVQQYKEGVLK
jgi:UDP-N-acetylmuramoylalanine--D-glutamate ligase